MLDRILIAICQMMCSSRLNLLVLYRVKRTVAGEEIMTSHHPRLFDNVLWVDVL